MSEEQLKAFLEAVKADEGLQEQLKAAADADAVVAIAKSAGFAISAEELQRAQAELSDEELEGVAGWHHFNCGDHCWTGYPEVP
jgi:predicted ribosomally synthesized peptide with nif11-like leader